MNKITLALFLIVITTCSVGAQTFHDTLAQTTCESYTWRGKTYTTSGLYYDTVVLGAKDTTFSFTGSDQSFTVPIGTTNLGVALSGAGGGVGHNDYSYTDGGSGAYVTGVVSVTSQAVINVIVGEGGASGIEEKPNDSTYGGGTAGTYINNGHHGGAGGGRTALQISGKDVVSAGGGGGGGYTKDGLMKVGGAGGSGTGPNGGGTGGGYPYDSTAGDGAGGYSYLNDPLFTLVASTNGGANNAGIDSTVSVDGGNGKALISWVKDSVYVLNLTINETDASVTVNGTTITANENGVAYQWLDCDNNYSIISGETGQSFTAIANGNYAVELSKNGCVDTSDCASITSVSIAVLSKNVGVSVYPNPTTEMVNVAFDQSVDNVELEITDMQGKMVSRQMFGTFLNTSIKMPDPVGIYFLTIKTEEGYNTLKLIRE